MTEKGTPGSANALRVLVVDDDEFARGGLVRMLSRMGCEVTAAADAQEAVCAFLSGRFDLITLDHRMPGMSGMELHRALSQEFGAGKRTTGFVARKLPPVLVVTAYAEEPEVVEGQFGESILGVLQKPLVEEELRRIVGSIRGD
jgi:CheY-like chemotaxis protein